MHISRGFHGRHREAADSDRIPPGQYVTSGFPVLSAGPTPRVALDHPPRVPADTAVHAGYLAVWTAYGMLAYGLGIWVAVSPATVPGLTDPGGSPSMQMGPTGA